MWAHKDISDAELNLERYSVIRSDRDNKKGSTYVCVCVCVRACVRVCVCYHSTYADIESELALQ